MEERERQPRHLAWHETLEVHELVMMQSTALMKMKMFIGEVKDQSLRGIYREGISNLEKNLRELLEFYALAPREDEDERERDLGKGFYAAELLSFTKAAISSYATAVSETATPRLRKVLTNQLVKCIEFHGKVFQYMYDNGLYPAYDLKKLLENDLKNARKALDMRGQEEDI